MPKGCLDEDVSIDCEEDARPSKRCGIKEDILEELTNFLVRRVVRDPLELQGKIHV